MSVNAFAQEWGGGWDGRAARDRVKDWSAKRGWAFTQGHHRKHGRPSPDEVAEFMQGHHREHGRPSPEDVEELMAMRHMRGGGPFGGGPWGGPFGGGPFGGGPRNGYQLMQEIEERSGGRWRPSPGSVYPTLAQLEDEGLVRASDSEGQRRFEITEAGREVVASRPEQAAPWEPDEDGENPLVELGPLVIQVGKAAWQVASAGDERQRSRAIELLAETRRGLYRILAEDPDETA